MKFTIFFLGLGFLFLILGLVLLSRRIAFFSMVAWTTALVTYLDSTPLYLGISFLVLSLIFIIGTRFIREEKI